MAGYDEYDDLYLKRRNVKRWCIVLAAVLVILAAVEIRIKNVTVQGNSTYTAEEAEALVFPGYWDKNSAYCLIKKLTGRKEELPFVEDYEIVFTSPVSVNLRFYEKSPIGCVDYMSSYLYFDKDGVVIESSQQRLDGVPVVTGLKFGHVVLGKELPITGLAVFNNILSITQELSLYGIGCDTIEFDDSGAITVYLTGGDIAVYMGSDGELAARVSALNDMLPGLRERGLTGTLDLSTYDDRDKGSTSSFKLRKEEQYEQGETDGQRSD